MEMLDIEGSVRTVTLLKNDETFIGPYSIIL